MKRGLRLLIVLFLIALAQTAFSFARFAYFTDNERGLSFYWGDVIYGPLHSNDYLRINGPSAAGYPQFYGPVSTAREDVLWTGITIPNYDIFQAGLWVNYPDSSGYPYPPEEAIDFMWQNAGLSILSTPAYIDTLDSWEEIATTLRIRNSILRIEQWLYDHFYPNGDTIYYEDRYQYRR